MEFGENEEISSMCEVYINDGPDASPQPQQQQPQQQPETALTSSQQQKTAHASSQKQDPGAMAENKHQQSDGLFAVEEKLKPAVVESGETASFLVVLTRPAANYTWLINDKPIKNGGKYSFEQPQPDHYALTINDCDMSLDKKSVQFVGYVGEKEVSSVARMTVIPATPALTEVHDYFFYK